MCTELNGVVSREYILMIRKVGIGDRVVSGKLLYGVMSKVGGIR